VAENPTDYMASEDANFTGASWQAYTINPTYNLSAVYGEKTVYVKVKNAYGESKPMSDSITYGVEPSLTSFVINNDSPQTSDSTVTLNITVAENPTDYMASEDANFTGASWQAYTINPTYNLSAGYGEKTVYVKVKNVYGESNVLSSKIEYNCNKGDVSGDGDIKPNDALLVLKIMAGLMEPTPQQECAADINDDGVINSKDAIIILRKSAGLEAPPNTNIVSKINIVTVSLSELYGTVGDSITSTLKIDGIQDLAGGDICITYNDLVLRAVGVISSDQNALLVSNITQPGIIHISFASSGSLNNNMLAKILFSILTDKFTPLNFKNVEFYSSDTHPLSSRIINGVFKSWAIPPKYSALLQNFPNPFNPDTWIPYQLKEGSDVMIRVYSSTGELVRKLALGHKSAGSYLSRDRAAYWDGNNDAGERVANGVYFYSIHANGFTNVKKLIVLK
jgi:hypothetical protein